MLTFLSCTFDVVFLHSIRFLLFLLLFLILFCQWLILLYSHLGAKFSYPDALSNPWKTWAEVFCQHVGELPLGLCFSYIGLCNLLGMFLSTKNRQNFLVILAYPLKSVPSNFFRQKHHLKMNGKEKNLVYAEEKLFICLSIIGSYM